MIVGRARIYYRRSFSRMNFRDHMRSNQRRALAIVLVVFLSASLAWAVDRAWQTGVWKDVQVKRARVVFGVAPGDPNSGGRRAPPPTRETRLYVIETDDLRLELKQ